MIQISGKRLSWFYHKPNIRPPLASLATTPPRALTRWGFFLANRLALFLPPAILLANDANPHWFDALAPSGFGDATGRGDSLPTKRRGSGQRFRRRASGGNWRVKRGLEKKVFVATIV